MRGHPVHSNPCITLWILKISDLSVCICILQNKLDFGKFLWRFFFRFWFQNIVYFLYQILGMTLAIDVKRKWNAPNERWASCVALTFNLTLTLDVTSIYLLNNCIPGMRGPIDIGRKEQVDRMLDRLCFDDIKKCIMLTNWTIYMY